CREPELADMAPNAASPPYRSSAALPSRWQHSPLDGGYWTNRSSEETLFRRADPERSDVQQRVFHARFASGRRPREKEGARQSSSRVQANGNVALEGRESNATKTNHKAKAYNRHQLLRLAWVLSVRLTRNLVLSHAECP